MSAADGRARVLRDLGLGDEDLAAWRRATLPEERFEAWLVDRVARRPGGPRARRVYGAEGVHDFARRAILEALALRPDDRPRTRRDPGRARADRQPWSFL